LKDPIQFPSEINDPTNYFTGLEAFDRIICRNVLVFERKSKGALQQKHLANRMHHRYVLMRALKTRGVVSVDGKTVRLDEGDALLVSPYQFHHYIDLEKAALHWIFITFELENGEAALAELSNRSIKPDDLSRRMWVEIAHLWTSDQVARRSELMPVLDRLLTRIHSNQKMDTGSEKTLPHPKNEWIAHIEALIFKSVRHGWTFQEVARRAGISERHLRSRFESQMGITLKDYRSNYQFHLAISLMRNPEFSLSDVAELSGFNSQSVFTRFIRRMCRQAPRVLREQIRVGNFSVG